MPSPKNPLLNILVIDFETYYATGYSLKGSKAPSTSEYVRDPRFKAHGAAVRLPEWGETRWITHDRLESFFLEIDWPNTAILCHNTAFDGFILSHHYGVHPGFYLDTLSMSRGFFGIGERHDLSAVAQRLNLGSKFEGVLESTKGIRDLPADLEAALSQYAIHDTDLTWEIFSALYPQYPVDELRIIDLTLKAFCQPKLFVNEALAQTVLDDEIATRARLIVESGATEKQLVSNPQFAELLRSRGVEPPTKISPRTGEETYAFAKADISFQELATDPLVLPLYKARIAAKSNIGHTRARRLLNHGVPGPLPILMNYCGAHTMRWSGGDKMNPQNLPTKRTGDNRLRRSIIAPPGYVLVVADSSQIEARTLAWWAGEEELLDLFRSGADPYAHMAQKVFGYAVDKKSKERQLGKTAILGLGYGMGTDKFQYTVEAGLIGPPMELSYETADLIKVVYRTSHPHIVALWRAMDQRLTAMLLDEFVDDGFLQYEFDRVRMPNGLYLHYPELKAFRSGDAFYDFSYRSREGRTKIYGAKLVENIVQCLARIIVAQQALSIANKYDIVLLVHDEVVFLAREDEAEEAYAYGIQCLSTPPSWCATLPVAAEGGFDRAYVK